MPSSTIPSFVDHYRALGLTGGPLEQTEIARLEAHLGLPLPAAYRAYLTIAGGSAPANLVGSHCDGEALFQLRDWAVELLHESGHPFSLPDDAIVFLMHQGYYFAYFHADGANDDPPVYSYQENRPKAERLCERFSNWVAAIV